MASLQTARRRRRQRQRKQAPKATRILLTLAGVSFGIIFLATVAAVATVWGGYAFLTSDLPDPEVLVDYQLSESIKIYDRNGQLLYTVNDPTEGQRTMLSFDEIPPVMKQAIIAAEDRSFYSNPGFDLRGISRAVLGVVTGRYAGGGSTITQQLARAVFLTPEVSIERKLKEIILAYEISQRFSKDEILALYLNQIAFGNLAYGIEAAANVYFDKPAQDLTLAEASMLAGIIQAPSSLNPFVNTQGARERQLYVLNQMVENGFITEQEAATTYANEPVYSQRSQPLLAPHFVFYVRKLLEELFDADTLSRGGLHVTTTLDLRYQELAERVAREQITKLAAHDASNAALIALDPKTGEILAMLGSVDYGDQSIDGQVNVTTSLRQPGSSIKPIFYAAAFEKGWTPATLIWDVPITIEIPGSPIYAPKNYDEKFHGPAPVRAALANSYNIPAVQVVLDVGVSNGIAMARRLGISSFADETYYGPAIVLGGAEVQLLELASAYSVFATNGLYRPAEAILNVTDSAGNVRYEFEPPNGIQRLSPQIAFLINSILSDNDARIPLFGEDSDLRLERAAAAKTGTTDNSKDNWTIGYTPNLLVGVWVGNSDGRPMKKTSGLTGAGPIWHSFMTEALQSLPEEEFKRPPGLVQVEVCRATGMVATPHCAETEEQVALETLCKLVSGYQNVADCGGTYLEYFIAGTEPTEKDTFFVPIEIHRETGQRAAPQTPRDQIEERVFFEIPLEARDWAQQEGIPLPPTEVHIPVPVAPLAISWPQPGRPVRSLLEIRGNVNIPNFTWYRVEFGSGREPERWTTLDPPQTQPVVNGVLFGWDTFPLNGVYTIRIIARDTGGQEQVVSVPVTIDNTPPHVELLSPQADGTFPLGPMTISAHATDDQALDQVAFFIDGEAIAVRERPPFEVSWNPRGAAGAHTLFVVAFDKAGNQTATPQLNLYLQE